MKIRNLILFCVFSFTVNSFSSIPFLRKTVSLAIAIGVSYSFEQEKLQEFVNLLHKEFGGKPIAMHCKITNKTKYNKTLAYPAYCLRGLIGLTTFGIIDYLLKC